MFALKHLNSTENQLIIDRRSMHHNFHLCKSALMPLNFIQQPSQSINYFVNSKFVDNIELWFTWIVSQFIDSGGFSRQKSDCRMIYHGKKLIKRSVHKYNSGRYIKWKPGESFLNLAALHVPSSYSSCTHGFSAEWMKIRFQFTARVLLLRLPPLLDSRQTTTNLKSNKSWEQVE